MSDTKIQHAEMQNIWMWTLHTCRDMNFVTETSSGEQLHSFSSDENLAFIVLSKTK